MSPLPRRVLCAVLIATQLTGCMVWSTAGPTPAQYLADHHPGKVRVSRGTNPALLLIDPTVRNDSLHGFPETGGLASFPLSEVDSIAVHRVSWLRTLGVAGAVAGGVALAALLSNCDNTRSIC